MYFKLKPKIICVLMVLLVSSQWTFNTMIAQASYSNGIMYNEYIGYATLANGTYSIGTTGGDPSSSSDDNKLLLYGHPTTPTSYTTLRIDNSNYIFNPNLTPVVDELNLSSTSEYTIGSVNFRQIVTIVDNTSTGRRDTVQIKYIAQNTDVSLSHNVGLRIMMDIDIAGNDLAPIRVPGIGIVKNELELNEDNVPSYWQAFDSSTNPSVIAQGTLVKNEAGRPNKVQFVNYSSISMSSNQWGYTVDTSKQIGDSALDITWNENILAPGQTKEYVTYCGLSEFTQDLTTPLAVCLTGDSKIQSDISGYSPNPFTITSYITNIGNTNATNVKARIILPAGLTLANSQQAEVNLGSCLVQEEKQASWKISITPSTTERTLTYSLNVWADNIQSKTINKTIYIPALGEWVRKANMTTTRYGNTVSVVNGKIYSIGGAPVMGSVTNVNEQYDPITDSWTGRTSMSTARSFAGSAVVNGKIYVIGGWNGNTQPYSTVEEYDPVTNTWVAKANMPTARYGFSTAVVNNKIYIMGGCIGNYYNGVDEAIIEVYDPTTNTWQQKANMPIARSGAGAAVYNDKIYVMGGRSNNIFSNSVQEYNPVTETWVTKANMPTARRTFGTAIIGNKIFAIGGNPDNTTYLNTVEEFDVSTNKWTTQVNLPTARYFPEAVAVNSCIYTISGYNGSALNIVEELILNAPENSPSIPQNIETFSTDTGCTIKWDNVYNASSYDLEIDSNITNVGLNREYICTGLSTNTPHYFRVRAKNICGIGEWSQTAIGIVREYTSDITPQMLSNTTSTYTATASSASSSTQDAYKAFNHVNSTQLDRWVSGVPSTSPQWLMFDFGENNLKNILKYSILSKTYTPAAPKAWTFEGSNDAVNWDVLDTQTNQVSWNSNARAFYINNNNSYRYYRINITQNNGYTGYFVSIDKLEMMQEYELDLDTPSNIIANPSANSVRLSWTGVSDATKYDIYANGTIIKDNTNTYYVHSSLQADTEYTYKVRAKGETGISNWSSPITIKTLAGDLTPAMTSNTTSTYTATASSISSSTQDAYKAFNHVNSTQLDRWVSGVPSTSPQWLMFDFGINNLKKVQSYVILSKTYTAAAPKAWTFEGSNDAVNWDVLDTQTNQVSWNSNARTFYISNNNSYRYYRINITQNNGYTGYFVSIDELELM